MKKRRIVITGLGAVTCFGNDVDTFYQSLLDGKSGVNKITRVDLDHMSTHIAADVTNFDLEDMIDKKQARRLDRYAQFILVAGKKAAQDAKLTKEALENVDLSKCGVLIGSGMGGMSVFYNNSETIIEKGYKRVNPFFVPYIITNIGGALLGADLGFMGPNYSVSTACATGNYSIMNAANHIRLGHADIMITGGAEDAILPLGVAGFIACRALSQNNENPQGASRPWDKNRDGFVMGSGAGVLVLEELEHAKKRGAKIYGEYLGGGISCDAYHITDPRPDGKGVALSIENALKDAEKTKDDVNYINAHATSTPVGDMAEVRAVKKVFGNTDKIKMNATKSMIGHGLGAAGGLEAIVTVKAIETGKIHPTINLEKPRRGTRRNRSSSRHLPKPQSKRCNLQLLWIWGA